MSGYFLRNMVSIWQRADEPALGPEQGVSNGRLSRVSISKHGEPIERSTQLTSVIRKILVSAAKNADGNLEQGRHKFIRSPIPSIVQALRLAVLLEPLLPEPLIRELPVDEPLESATIASLLRAWRINSSPEFRHKNVGLHTGNFSILPIKDLSYSRALYVGKSIAPGIEWVFKYDLGWYLVVEVNEADPSEYSTNLVYMPGIKKPPFPRPPGRYEDDVFFDRPDIDSIHHLYADEEDLQQFLQSCRNLVRALMILSQNGEN